VADLIRLLLFDYTVRTVALGATILGVVSGVLGSFAVLRRQSLFGDALAHAALPGVCLAFLVTGGKAASALLLGAALSGWAGALTIIGVTRGSRVKPDAALGTVLTVFFGLGIVLLTRIQRTGSASQSGLNHFLFGQAALLLERDVALMAGLGAVALLLVALLYKEFKLLAFDPDFGRSLGFPMGGIGVILTALLTIAVVIGLQTVGVVLMAALLIAPAAAARQWTDRLGTMIGLAALFGALSGVSGAVLSSLDARLPTGPLVVLLATLIVTISLGFSPRRGLVPAALRRWRVGRHLARERLLAGLAGSAGPGGTFAPERAGGQLRGLARQGIVRPAGVGAWELTTVGRAEALAADRAWQGRRAGLARGLGVAEEEVHLAAADLARVLSADTLQELNAEGAGRGPAGANGASDAARPTAEGRPASREGHGR
jgi:manganese/zinc/iron transport system permease protein